MQNEFGSSSHEQGEQSGGIRSSRNRHFLPSDTSPQTGEVGSSSRKRSHEDMPASPSKCKEKQLNSKHQLQLSLYNYMLMDKYNIPTTQHLELQHDMYDISTISLASPSNSGPPRKLLINSKLSSNLLILINEKLPPLQESHEKQLRRLLTNRPTSLFQQIQQREIGNGPKSLGQLDQLPHSWRLRYSEQKQLENIEQDQLEDVKRKPLEFMEQEQELLEAMDELQQKQRSNRKAGIDALDKELEKLNVNLYSTYSDYHKQLSRLQDFHNKDQLNKDNHELIKQCLESQQKFEALTDQLEQLTHRSHLYILQNRSLNDLEQAKTQDRKSLAQRFQDYREGQHKLEKRDRQKLLNVLDHLPFRVQLRLIEHNIRKSINSQYNNDLMKISLEPNEPAYQSELENATKLYENNKYLLSVYISYHSLRREIRNGLENIARADKNDQEAINKYHKAICDLKDLYEDRVNKLNQSISEENDNTNRELLERDKLRCQQYIGFLNTVEDQYHKKHVAELKQLLTQRYEHNKMQLANDPNYEEKLCTIEETYNNDLAILPIQYAKVLGWMAREELASDIDLPLRDSAFNNWK